MKTKLWCITWDKDCNCYFIYWQGMHITHCLWIDDDWWLIRKCNTYNTQILCFHWLSIFGNSKVMNFGILFNIPNLDTNLFSTSSAFKHTTISILTDSPFQRASNVVAGPLTDLVTCTDCPWKAGTACIDKALSIALWIASRACKSDNDVSYVHAFWAMQLCPATFLCYSYQWDMGNPYIMKIWNIHKS